MMGLNEVMEPKGVGGSQGAKELRRLMKFKQVIEVKIKRAYM
jgi:hypothetical protein